MRAARPALRSVICTRTAECLVTRRVVSEKKRSSYCDFAPARFYEHRATHPLHSTRGLGEETKLVLRLRAGEVLRASSNAPTALDAKATDIYAATVGQSPTTASVAQQFPSAKRITPGSHDESLV